MAKRKSASAVLNARENLLKLLNALGIHSYVLTLLMVAHHEQLCYLLAQTHSVVVLKEMNQIIRNISLTESWHMTASDPLAYIKGRLSSEFSKPSKFSESSKSLEFSKTSKLLPLPESLESFTSLIYQYYSKRQSLWKLKKRTAKRLGLHIPSLSKVHEDPVPGLPPNVPRIFVRRLENPYPPLDHYIHECVDEQPARLPRKKDRTCGYRSKIHILDTAQLAYTLGPTDSAVFIDPDEPDPSKRVVGIVLRDFASGSSAQIL